MRRWERSSKSGYIRPNGFVFLISNLKLRQEDNGLIVPMFGFICISNNVNI
ncbi:hypothetical protein THIOM_001572 [Candidatus Thiomargarita nelsonii]|uniref:Uncharacterized protein n=1 Tax=Candidatus Thiomargarita nelsonii TaxID=1003181 RepID=A0A176S3L3_9GAMM|nr:hypothetical protein THIOM_001572 [Candidatus Thiomargarita nelsonii]